MFKTAKVPSREKVNFMKEKKWNRGRMRMRKRNLPNTRSDPILEEKKRLGFKISEHRRKNVTDFAREEGGEKKQFLLGVGG